MRELVARTPRTRAAESLAKTLDAKLARIHADPAGARDFVLADAKDADMAFGLAAPGTDPATGRQRSLADYRDQMREIIHQGLVDLVVMSVSSAELLVVEERLFADSPVTAAVRGNDTTDIHHLAGGTYAAAPSRPFRTPTVEQIVREAGADLALYSVTPANDVAFDLPALEAYRTFRLEAEGVGLRHLLEVFAPNVPGAVPDPGRFLNDWIARTLAGVPKAGRPLFLKLPYLGPAGMEELAAYDPHLVPGILGGASGTTHDAFRLLEEARRHGARAALFGRRIKDSEHPLSFVRLLRAIADGELGAEAAVREYHGELAQLGVTARRSLGDDLALTQSV